MSSGPRNTSAAKLPLASTEANAAASAAAWVIAPDLHLGFAGRLREVWRYRRILLFFALKSIQTLYANTRLGLWWLLVRPLAPVLVGTLVFGRLMGAPSEGIPYFLFFLVGSIIWSSFAEPLMRGSRGLEVNRQLLTKLYLPRVILPAGQLAAGLVEPVVLTAVFAVTVWYYRATTGIWYGVDPGRVPLAVLAVVLAIVFAFAGSLWTSVWQARARDLRYVVGYALSFWFFLTPVVYPRSMMPAHVQRVALLNPMTGPVEAFRWALLGIGAPDWTALGISAAVIAMVLTLGLWFFTTTESGTVDKL